MSETHRRSTRFRAYKLGVPGDSFSYFDGNNFTLIEARLNDTNRPNLVEELGLCGKTEIDVLHITSWDEDHCAENELKEILDTYKPAKVEYPGYTPHTDNGKACRRIICKYIDPSQTTKNGTKTAQKLSGTEYTPEYINGLNPSEKLTKKNIVYWPKELDKEPNNNSIVCLFRSGEFNVLSTGDVEKAEIAHSISTGKIMQNEVDVLILAHHGADNGFTSKDLLKALEPHIAICGVDRGNEYEHPKARIRQLFYHQEVPFFTTKDGDVVVEKVNGRYKTKDFIKEGETIAKAVTFTPKKKKFDNWEPFRINDYYRKKTKFTIPKK